MEGLDNSSNNRSQTRITGREAEEIVKKIKTQAAEWGLTLPSAEPLVLDFGLGDFYTSGGNGILDCQ